MTDLDTQPRHHAAIDVWRDRFGDDMPVESVISWEQHGWRWSAFRDFDGWLIADGQPVGWSQSTQRPHTWDMLCSRLTRMGAEFVARYRPGRGEWTVPYQVAEPAEYPRNDGIPWLQFPNIGAMT